MHLPDLVWRAVLGLLPCPAALRARACRRLAALLDETLAESLVVVTESATALAVDVEVSRCRKHVNFGG